jgi:DNA-binding MarR family transcriptional regulator
MHTDPYSRPGFAIGRTNYLFRKRIIEELDKVDSMLSPEEAWILMVLDDAGGTAQTGALRGVMQRDASTLTRQLDAMCKKKLIRRERDAADGRVINVVLTAASRREPARVMPGFKALRESAVAGISQENLRIMTQSLPKIQDNLQSEQP